MKDIAKLNDRKIEQLRMLSDWQLRQLGYDPNEITKKCLELDSRKPGA